MILVEVKLILNREWRTPTFSTQAVQASSQIQREKIRLEKAQRRKTQQEKMQQEKVQQEKAQRHQQAMSGQSLSHPWTVIPFSMTDRHPPWMSLNHFSITHPHPRQVSIHREANLLLPAQKATLQQKLLRQLVNLDSTLQEDGQLWEKTLAKLLVRLPNSLSSKGRQMQVKLLQVQPKISPRALQAQLAARSKRYSGVMVEVGQIQNRVMQGLWTEEVAVAAAQTATTRIAPVVITTIMSTMRQLLVLEQQ